MKSAVRPSLARDFRSPAAAPGPELLFYSSLQTPLGPMLICGGELGLRVVSFSELPPPGAISSMEQTQPYRVQLREYFAGHRRVFDLEIDWRGPAFYRHVWKTMLHIPYGTTVSYGELAAMAGNPRAVRATGTANARNRLAVVIPCHRVVAANGRPGGYSAPGGLNAKRWLLQHEQRFMDAPAALS